jgi:dethiobiotin synthetase
MRCLIVTGTDTHVGKTEVAAGLVRHWRNSGISVAGYKPAASGAEQTAHGPRWHDAEALFDASDRVFPIDRICPQRFLAPLAPPMAAAAEGRIVSLDEVYAGIEWFDSQGVDWLVIEGAGGLLCPLTDDADFSELFAEIRAPIVIVARAGLGTINHTLLTLEAARTRGLTVRGVILNNPVQDDGNDPSRGLNAAEISRRGRVRILAEIPFQTGLRLSPPEALTRIDIHQLASDS